MSRGRTMNRARTMSRGRTSSQSAAQRARVVTPESSPALPDWRKPAESMWTAVAVEPVAVRLAPWLARQPAVTPNRITAFAALLGIVSAVCLGLGALAVGGLLFQLRYLVDCLDGKVARIRGASSARGGAFDLMVDVLTITANYAALSWYLVRTGSGSLEMALAIVATSMVFAWMLLYRKGLETALKRLSPDVHGAPASTRHGAIGGYLDWMARHRSMPVPYAVEAEILCLSLVPLAVGLFAGLTDRPLVWCLWVASAFYAAAIAVNGRRIWRLAGQVDRTTQNP